MSVSVVSRLILLRNALVIGAAIAALGAASAAAKSSAVYTATNDPAGNAVVVYTRNANGTIVKHATVKTGGTGIASQPPFGFPIVDSSGSLNLTSDGRLLFVVNDGDNTISSFRVTGSGLKLVDHVSSGGILPVSLTSSGNLLYVVNERSGNIYGLRFSSTGHLSPIRHSKRALSKPGLVGVAAQIGFAPGGGWLIVTQRGLPSHHGTIDTFKVFANGRPGVAHAHTANAPNPFGFAFTAPTHLLVTNVGFVATPPNTMPNPGDQTQFTGSASSYDLRPFGGLSATGNVLSGGRGACWVALTFDKRYAFVVNTLSTFPPGNGVGAVSRYRVSSNGKLTLLGQTDTGPGFPTDDAVSSNGRYLYVLNPNPFGMGTPSHIDVYRVGTGGSLTHIQATPNELAPGVSGIGVS